ncbi:MAG: YceI family protein [Pedobacter sp.]|nr:MAG: YceI family protein [Pedobacter sp.]
MMILFHLFTLILLAFTAFGQQQALPVKWALSKECSLKVNGRTNVNKFSCIIPEYIRPDTLCFMVDKVNDEIKVSGQMVLNVKNFDCHNIIMTKDLRRTLKAEQFPKVVVRFVSLKRYPGTGIRGVTGVVMISLAGVTKQFEVNYLVTSDDNKGITLIGTKQVSFSDFKIVPPRKLGRMIKTNDTLEVEFVLKASILS